MENEELIKEREFINKTISEWNSAYANKSEQKILLRLIFDKIEDVYQQINSLKTYL